MVFLSIGVYFFVDPILAWLAKPVGRFIFLAPTEALFVRIKVALGGGLVLAFPILLYQAWRFIGIGLKNNEQSMLLFVIPVSCMLFYAGMSLALFGVVPMAVRFLIEFGSTSLMPTISIQSYLSFLIWMIVGFGLFFQMPLLVLVVVRFGLIQGSTLALYRKHILVGVVILAAVMTPGGDIISQLVLSLPTYLLFESSLYIARRFEPKK